MPSSVCFANISSDSIEQPLMPQNVLASGDFHKES